MRVRGWVVAGGLAGALVIGAVVVAALGSASTAAAAPAGGSAVLLLVDANGVTTPVNDLSSFTFGAENPGDPGGTPRFETLTVERPVDGASVAVFKSLVQGARYAAASLVVRDGGDADVTYQFRDLYATQITWSGGVSGLAGETVDFSYSALQLTYTGGGTPATVSFAWDAQTHRPGL